MHELSIAQGLVRAAVTSAGRHGAGRVVRLHVVVGALAGVEPAALAFCFPAAAAGTPCEGAELAIDVEPAAGHCARCGADSDVRDFMTPCPGCGAWPLQLEGGRGMTLRALEVR